jgi:hypothetical protein
LVEGEGLPLRRGHLLKQRVTCEGNFWGMPMGRSPYAFIGVVNECMQQKIRLKSRIFDLFP